MKIAVAESPDGRPKQVKIELSSEADLFFMYSHVVDEKTFNAMRDDQKLTVDFATYATILATSFQNAIKVGEALRGDSCGLPKLPTASWWLVAAPSPVSTPPSCAPACPPACLRRSRTPSSPSSS